MALINKHFEEVLGDIGVIKLWTIKVLGITVYREESLSERVSEIGAFQSVPRIPVGFQTTDENKNIDEETKDKSEGVERQVPANNNGKGRIRRLTGKR